MSLFSRQTIALATTVALSHGMFEDAGRLGSGDKFVPGLLIGVLRFGHLPMLFVPASPMGSGIANTEKQRVRQRHAEGKAGRRELLKNENASYHAADTCTFSGAVNSNQMIGLQLPGSSFVHPGAPLRRTTTRAATHRLAAMARDDGYRLGRLVDERAIVNAAVGLLATGEATSRAIHLPANARAAGTVFDWGMSTSDPTRCRRSRASIPTGRAT